MSQPNDPPSGAPNFDEANVLFDLVLPTLCRRYADHLAQAQAAVEFRIQEAPARVWHVRAEQPWVFVGPASNAVPVISVGLSMAFVRALAQGEAPDIDAAIAQGHLVLGGDVQALSSLPSDLANLLGFD